MDIHQFLVTIYVRDQATSIDWYTRFFGRTFDRQPQPNCREWEVTPKAYLQVIENGDLASGHAAFVVHDLPQIEARLAKAGIVIEKKKIGPYEVSQCTDPDGHVLTLLRPQ